MFELECMYIMISMHDFLSDVVFMPLSYNMKTVQTLIYKYISKLYVSCF